MENEDQESPSSSPVPGPSRDYEDDLALGGEAEPYEASRSQEEELGLGITQQFSGPLRESCFSYSRP